MQMWYYVSSTYADPGIFAMGGGEVRGSRQKKSSIAWKKNSGKLFFVFSPNLQLLNSFAEGGGPIFLFDLILFVPSTISQLYTLEGVRGGGGLSGKNLIVW